MTTKEKLTILCDEGDSTKFKEELAKFEKSITTLLKDSKLIDPLNEATLQSIITSTFSQAGFFFGNEIATDDNTKADVILFSDKSGIVIELKCGDRKTAEDAFKQIFIKHYYKIFGTEKHDNISLTLFMGIHVNPENEAYVMCLQRKDIVNVQNVLFNLPIDVQQPLLEKRIEMGVKKRKVELKII